MISNDILIVADKPRIQRILDNLEDHWGRSIVSVSSLSEASVHLVDGDNFGLILVQDRMSGLSHEIILRHIRSSLNDRDAIIALATEEMDIHDAEPSLQLLDLSLPDREILKMLERILARLPANDSSSVREAFAKGEENFTEEYQVKEEKIEPADLPQETAEDKPVDSVVQSQLERISGRFEAELETEIARIEETPPEDVTLKGELPLTVNEMIAATEMKRKRSIIPWIAAALLILVAAFYFSSLGEKPKAVTTAKKIPNKQISIEPVQKKITTAAKAVTYPPPKFISKTGALRDNSFSRAGWERYSTDRLEFRIFRENGIIKAIQALSITNHDISPDLFSGAIREIANVADYRTTSRSIEKGYLVKRGKLGSDGRITIYKAPDDSALRGFVIEPHAGTEKQ